MVESGYGIGTSFAAYFLACIWARYRCWIQAVPFDGMVKEQAMVVMKSQDFVVKYYPDMIVIDGDTEAIHAEADNILRRFAASSRAFQVSKDTSDHIVLVVKNAAIPIDKAS